MIEEILEKGEYLDVSLLARKFFPVGRVLIERRTHERFVHWGSKAMREYGECIEEFARLEQLLKAAGAARSEDLQVVFGCRAVDTENAQEGDVKKTLLLKRFDNQSTTVWWIQGGKPH